MVTIFFHWMIATIVLTLLALGWYMVELTYYDPLYNSLPFIHKSIGVLLAAVLIVKLGWRLFDRAPSPIAALSALETTFAGMAHIALNTLILFIIISGYLIPTANGEGISVFDWFEVPASMVEFPDQEDTAGLLHKVLAYALVGFIAVHMAAACKHHFIQKNDVLRRMLGLTSNHS